MRSLVSLVIAAALIAGPSVAPAASAVSPSNPTTFTTLGDSHTTGNYIQFAAGLAKGTSWVTTARSSTRTYVGGWARGGSTTTDMLAHAEPRDAEWLVLMVGSNDPGKGVEWSTTRSNILAMVEIVGADHVMMSAVPPRNKVEQRQLKFNRRLQALALEQGYTWVNPWAKYKNKKGGWISRYTVDDVHATKSVYRAIGKRFGTELAHAATLVEDTGTIAAH